jgi:hypothetical protein
MPDVATITDIDAKRPLLYLFSHKFLPGLVHRSPSQTRQVLADDAAKFIDMTWHAAESVGAKHGMPAAQLPAPSVAARRTVGDRQWYAIAMPQPLHATEVFYVGIGCGTADADYVTLELGYDVAARTGALVLCSWTSGGVHANWGAVELALEPEAFLDTCVGWRGRNTA